MFFGVLISIEEELLFFEDIALNQSVGLLTKEGFHRVERNTGSLFSQKGFVLAHADRIPLLVEAYRVHVIGASFIERPLADFNLVLFEQVILFWQGTFGDDTVKEPIQFDDLDVVPILQEVVVIILIVVCAQDVRMKA